MFILHMLSIIYVLYTCWLSKNDGECRRPLHTVCFLLDYSGIFCVSHVHKSHGLLCGHCVILRSCWWAIRLYWGHNYRMGLRWVMAKTVAKQWQRHQWRQCEGHFVRCRKILMLEDTETPDAEWEEVHHSDKQSTTPLISPSSHPHSHQQHLIILSPHPH